MDTIKGELWIQELKKCAFIVCVVFGSDEIQTFLYNNARLMFPLFATHTYELLSMLLKWMYITICSNVFCAWNFLNDRCRNSIIFYAEVAAEAVTTNRTRHNNMAAAVGNTEVDQIMVADTINMVAQAVVVMILADILRMVAAEVAAAAATNMAAVPTIAAMEQRVAAIMDHRVVIVAVEPGQEVTTAKLVAMMTGIQDMHLLVVMVSNIFFEISFFTWFMSKYAVCCI